VGCGVKNREPRKSGCMPVGISHQLLLGPMQERERWVKESEEGRRLETLVARLNNMSATWGMTDLETSGSDA
jgi:hypothetical protein